MTNKDFSSPEFKAPQPKRGRPKPSAPAPAHKSARESSLAARIVGPVFLLAFFGFFVLEPVSCAWHNYVSSRLQNAAARFFEATGKGDFTKAHSLLTRQAQASVDECTLKTISSGLGILKIRDTQWEMISPAFNNHGTGALEGLVQSDLGNWVPLEISFAKDGGEWKIDALHDTSGKSNGEVRFLQARAECGNAEAQNTYGLALAQGKDVKQDRAAAVTWFRKAAEQGHADAQTHLGYMLANGNGVDKDLAEGLRWTRKAAEQGHSGAQNNLGAMYAAGDGVPRDDAEAARWYRKSAEHGYTLAEDNIGMSYALGQGVAQDRAEAIRWLRRAAVKEDSEAQLHLGKQLLLSDDAKDKAEAFRWIDKAAKKGNAAAQGKLGELYLDGKGDNDTVAASWFKKAAERGDKNAQINWARMLVSGRGGVTKDESEAYFWYVIANPSDDAVRKERDALRPKLGSVGIAMLERRAATWKPLP
jgi:TPR repeat protein